MKKLITTFGALSLSAVVLTACGETTVEQVDNDNDNDTNGSETVETTENEDADEEATEEEELEALENDLFQVGDTISVNDVEITIEGAEFTEPAEYSEPEGRILTIDVSVVNNSDESQMVDSTDFNIYDANGSLQDSYFGYSEMAISGSINQGRNNSGKLFYDVVEQDEPYELTYNPFFVWDNVEITFEIDPQ